MYFFQCCFRGRLRAVLGLIAATGLACLPSQAQVSVTTQHNDNSRTGANLSETVLNTSNVNATTFGKLFAVTVDGEVYAQPLYMPQVAIAGGTHNVVYVATMNNSLYALDADNGAQLWKTNYGTPITASDVQCCCTDVSLYIGILGTPVIDPSTSTIYFVSRHKNTDGTYHQYLNALDITTGAARTNSPKEITATNSGITFDPKLQNQRSALTLANGNIYLAWSSHNDCGAYHGWVMAYSASTLAQTASWLDTPTGSIGGIWMSGQGLTVDKSGNVYVSTGNGSISEDNTGVNTGNSFVKLSPALTQMDWFTPFNSDSLNSGDQDLGSAGLLGLPIQGTDFLVGGGKQGMLYVVSAASMGKYSASSDNVVQEFQAVHGTGSSHIHGAPIYYNSPVTGPTIYIWGENDYLRAYAFNTSTGLFNTTAVLTSTMTAPMTNASSAMPGGFLSLSANGTQAGTAIIWASTPYNANANNNVVPGVFHAFDAATMREIWNDKTNDARDDIGRFAKFCAPTVANGKVYLPNFGPTGAANGSGQLVVYGLLPLTPIAPGGLTAASANSQVNLAWAAPTGNPATSYNLYRSTTQGGEGTTPYKSGLTSVTMADVSVANGTTYYYQVSGVNSNGEGPKSAEATATPTAIGLLSQGLPNSSYTASSVGGAGSSLYAYYAFDGDLGTRWASASSDPQWIQVDLGATKTITEIKLYWYQYAGSNYTLQVSNDASTWTTLQTVTGNNTTGSWLDYPISNASGRYVRMYGTKRNTTSGYSLQEFQAYGPLSLPTPIASSLSPTSVTAGSASFPLTITGSGYDGSTTVKFGSDTLTPVAASLTSTSLTVSVPAADVATAGTKTVTVSNPTTYGGGGASTANFLVTAAPASVAGVVSLQNVAPANMAQPMTFTLTPTGSTTGGVITQNLTLATDGSFTLTNIPAGTYTLGVKGSKWLRRDTAISTTGGNVTGLSVSLLGGDANGDNQVTALDLLAVKNAYNTVLGDPNYNAAADFNCDGQVTALDLLIVKLNYNKTGDP
jgi:hypothetical protein